MKKKHQTQIFAAVIFFVLWRKSSSNSPPKLTLPQGYVTGITIFPESGLRVNAFLGLPYALPPIGDLRFAPPERHPGWNQTLFAGHFRPDCPQLRYESQQSKSDLTNEDCLYLNVFVPEAATTYRNCPVVVFIQGVDYVLGSPLTVNAEEFTKEGLIIVSFSYRLNVFGFLTFEDEFARGNLGLLDQYMAIMWVRENIQYFGGLPNNITLMGHGSGASSILVHMTSPRTKNLFQRVILMSGSIFSPWLRSHPRSESHPVLLTSRNIARSLGCYSESYQGQKSNSVLACLRQKSSVEIMKAFASAYQNGNWSNSLGPISDDFLPPENQYLPLDPTEAVKLGKYQKLPILSGITCNEGTVVFRRYTYEVEAQKPANFTIILPVATDNWKELISQNEDSIFYFIKNTAIANILQRYNLNDPEIKALVTWNYFEKVPKETRAIHQLLKLYNEAIFAAPFWRQVQVLSQHNGEVPIFIYMFAHPSFDYIGNYRELLNLTASVHSSEILYLFGPGLFQKVSGRRFTSAEERLSIKMKRLWSYFIRLGDPTPPSYGYSLWDKFSNEKENFLKLYIDEDTGRNLQKVFGNPSKEASTLWNSLLPQVHETTKQKLRKLNELLFLSGFSNYGGDSGSCGSYKSAMFTTLAFLILLLVMLILSLIFLKRRTKERDRSIL